VAFDPQSIASNINSRWTGFRYQLLSAKFDISRQAIVLADVSEIEFPEIQIEYKEIPTLSSKQRKIPSRIVYGELTLRGSVIRSPILFQELKRTLDVLRGQGSYANAPNDFVIALYGNSSVFDALPIRQWLVKNAQPKSFKAAKASANDDGSMPVDEITFTVDEFRAL
jgi:hypothetical protein